MFFVAFPIDAHKQTGSDVVVGSVTHWYLRNGHLFSAHHAHTLSLKTFMMERDKVYF